MSKTKILSWLLTTALTCTLSMGLAACSDDNDEASDNRIGTDGGKSGIPDSLLTAQERLMMAQQSAISSILRTLAADATVGGVVRGQTFEATYGQVTDESMPGVRAVECRSAEDAESNFMALVGGNAELVTQTADGMQLSLRDLPLLKDGGRITLGDLTFHRQADGIRVAYVEVDIPAIPRLQRIDYVTSFADNGNLPYQVGDVVYMSRGSGYCSGYYLCVATTSKGGTLVHMCANEPGDDQTVNLDGDGEGCWYPYNKNKKSPTSFIDIKEYITFILDNQAKVASIKQFMEGHAAFKKPSYSGCLSHIFPEGFNNNLGVAFHSTDRRAAAIRFDAEFVDAEWYKCYDYRKSFYAKIPYDCKSRSSVENKDYQYYSDGEWFSHFSEMWNYTMNVVYFDSDSIIGAKLEFSALNDNPMHENDALAVTERHLGWCYASNNRLYETASKAKADGQTPLGVVAYVNDGSEFGNLVTEAYTGGGHGLVMAYSIPYSFIYGDPRALNPNGDDLFVIDNCFDGYISDSMESAWNDFGGCERTRALADADVLCAKEVLNYTPEAPEMSTRWFIPTAAQWLAMLCKPGLGGAEKPTGEASLHRQLGLNNTLNSCLTQADANGVELLASYWTSSAWDSKEALLVQFHPLIGARFYYKKVITVGLVRPVFAF